MSGTISNYERLKNEIDYINFLIALHKNMKLFKLLKEIWGLIDSQVVSCWSKIIE